MKKIKESPFNTKFNEATKKLQEIPQQAEPQKSNDGEQQNTKAAEQQSSISAEPQNRKMAKGDMYTDKTSVYFSPEQTEKLALIAIEYKKQTGKKIAANEIIRRLVDKGMLEDILV